MNKQLHDEAAHFFVEFQLGDDSPKTRRKFNAWLRKSPEHIRAYLQIFPGWDDSQQLPKAGIDELVAAAREGNIEALPGARIHSSRSNGEGVGVQRSKPVFYFLASAAALALFVVGSIAIYRAVENHRVPQYATKTGELLALQLTDGSTIRLNARSRIRVRFTDATRSVDLVQGQALFEVAKDPSRPFVVKTDDAQVRAVGTAFDVQRKSAATTVTVVEGTVVVSDVTSWLAGLSANNRSKQELSVILSAGQQATAAAKAITAPKRASAADATAWTERRLVFDDATLGGVVEEFNRYSEHALILDPELESLSITARFDSTDPASLVRFLATLPDVEVRHTGGDTEIRKSR